MQITGKIIPNKIMLRLSTSLVINVKSLLTDTIPWARDEMRILVKIFNANDRVAGISICIISVSNEI
jgi:hypothetical protein